MNGTTTTILTDEEKYRVSELSSRLRLIHADAASTTPEKRREYLQEEIARSVKDVPSANRKRYLEDLLARFPVAGQIIKHAPAKTSPDSPPPAPPVAESAEQILERFFTVAREFPDEKRNEAAKRLCEAGFVWMDRNALVLEIEDELRKSLGLGSGQQPNLSRLVQLTIVLIDILSRLDHTALTTLRELAPKNPLLKRPPDIRNAAARFLTKESDAVEPQLKTISSLIGMLLAAILGGGKEFGRQYVARFSPTAIEDVVTGEGGGGIFGSSKKERCWNKYTDLSADYATPDLVDRKIKDCLGRFVEKVPGGK